MLNCTTFRALTTEESRGETGFRNGKSRSEKMPRAIASAQIAFGLVSIPVKLFSATEASEKISFNMLHRDCGSRIQQQLFCPKDERNITRDEVVKGYEFSRGQYVLFTEEELKALEERSTQSIDITEFLPQTEIDPIYFSKAYYLGPDKGGDRAYTLLSKALQETERWALAKYSARGKQYLVVLRPLGEALVKDNELRMAVQLAEMGAADESHPENYHDEVSDRIRAVIQQKVEGQEITATEVEHPRAQVIDLMEALKASLASPQRKPAAAKMPIKAEQKRKAPKAAPRTAKVVAKARSSR